MILCLSKELDVAGMAVRILAMLFEGTLVEKLEAEGTVEVLRMPLFTHSSDALAWVEREGVGRGRGEGRELIEHRIKEVQSFAFPSKTDDIRLSFHLTIAYYSYIFY